MKLNLFICLTLLINLSACSQKMSSQDQAQFDTVLHQQILAEVKKTYPLPDSVSIINNVMGTLRYDTSLSVEQVTAFYRQAYTKEGLAEQLDIAVAGPEKALLAFSGKEKSVTVEAEKREGKTRVVINVD